MAILLRILIDDVFYDFTDDIFDHFWPFFYWYVLVWRFSYNFYTWRLFKAFLTQRALDRSSCDLVFRMGPNWKYLFEITLPLKKPEMVPEEVPDMVPEMLPEVPNLMLSRQILMNSPHLIKWLRMSKWFEMENLIRRKTKLSIRGLMVKFSLLQILRRRDK